MEPPPKRRRLFQSAQIHVKKDVSSMGNSPTAANSALGSKDLLHRRFLRETISGASKASLPTIRKTSPLLYDQGNPKSQHLHPRNLIPYQAADNVAKPIVQPVQTAVASFINVVLDNGGTSLGNVLVPAESTVFNLNGYGPVTINKNPPPNATPPAPTHPHRHSHGPQPTPQPAQPQPVPSAAASQSPMSIQVPGSSSQIILSSPPTPLPPSPSNSTSTATGSESYFSTTSSQTSSSNLGSAASSTSSSPITASSSQSPQVSNFGFTPTRGNLTTSVVTSSETVSGSTRVTTFPVIITPTANSTSITSSTSFGSLLTPSSSSDQASTTAPFNSTFATSIRSSTSSSFSSFTSSSSILSSASASSTSEGNGAPGGVGSPTGTAGGPPASSSTAAAASGGNSTPSTPTLVGSVVGGVAGLTLILVLLLFLLRRRKKIGQRRTISPPIPQSASTGPGANTGTMTERSSAAVPLAGAGFFRRLRPGSGATTATTDTAPSERGFQNLGGRKLESVLASRGDGFGDLPFGAAGASGATPGPSTSRGQTPGSIPIITAAPSAVPGHSSPESLSGSSFYRDSQGFYGGPGQSQAGPDPPSNSSSMFVGPGSPPQSPTYPPPGISLPSQEGVAVTRPGPARTPVITQPGGLSPLRGSPRPQRGTPPPPQIPGTIQERPRDGLGRSHPSLDGSRSSRFAENI
ncbi:MAG: hypothetical protein Q9170_000666 [Blastenia crenularia]